MESISRPGSWQRVITLGEPFQARSGHTAILKEKKIYIFGGFDGKVVLNDVQVFIIDENTWSNVSFEEQELILYPKPRTSHAACLDEDLQDKFYFFGGSGKNIGFENYNDLWIFDFATLSFREILIGKPTNFRPPGMYGHSMNYFSNFLYVFGGTSGFDFFKDIYRFDLLGYNWQKIILNQSPCEPEPRYKHCSLISEGKLLVIGGINQANRLGNIYEYDIKQRQWRILAIGKNKNLFKGANYRHQIYSMFCLKGDMDIAQQQPMIKPSQLILVGVRKRR